MRFERLSGLSAVIAGAITVLVFLCIAVAAIIFNQPIPYTEAAVAGGLSFFVTYLIVRGGLESFVHAKIKLIYRSINSFKSADKLQISQDIDNSLDAVRDEVEAWGEAHKLELEDYKKRETFRREFIGNLAHEIKTPIFNIQGYILTLLDGAVDDPNYNVRYLERAMKSVDRMIHLITDLDEISKLESGIVEIKARTFGLLELVKEVVESSQKLASSRKVKLEISASMDKPHNVLADPSKIRQVLDNLVNNAIKYGKEEGHVKVRLTPIDNRVLVEVIDDGPGIDAKHLPRLFERFYRIDSSRSREIGGSGLGLAICKHIIEAHKERISVRSNPDEGTVFSFNLKKA